jgi:hypothetical protein
MEEGDEELHVEEDTDMEKIDGKVDDDGAGEEKI